MVRSEGNMSLKNSVTPLEIDPGTVHIFYVYNVNAQVTRYEKTHLLPALQKSNATTNDTCK